MALPSGRSRDSIIVSASIDDSLTATWIGVYVEFVLNYRGKLKSNRGPRDKHKLRQHFHKQLKELWHQIPLDSMHDLLDSQSAGGTILKCLGGFQFAPLVSTTLKLVVELRIDLLRPEPPGSIVTQGGDIDNRLKTLLDALKIPDQPNAIPNGVSPGQDEVPFFCLLEDDNLVTGIDVRTERLLDPDAGDSDVLLLIHVRTKPVVGTWGNLQLS